MALRPRNAVPRAQRARGPGPASILVLHGSSLNLPGSREPEIYAGRSLTEINAGLGVLDYEFAVAYGLSRLAG